MKTSNSNVLLIGVSEDSSKFLFEIVKRQGYKCTFVNNIEMAIQRCMNELPDLILCYYDLPELNGFQVYNMLDTEILKQDVPFVMVFNQFRKNELLVGIELGIDSFIYPPFDSERIANIIRKQLDKTAERKAATDVKFDSVCRVIPYGIFVAENRKIVETNETFDRLVRGTPKLNGNYYLTEVFAFNSGNEDELKLSRFVNGLMRDCQLKGIKLRNNASNRYDLYFSHLSKRGASSQVIGIVVPERETDSTMKTFMFTNRKAGKAEFLDPNLITLRERQVLQLSATGAPIKQIAERLGISERTVEKHRSNIINKTNSENIMEAVFMYGKNHMLNV